MRKFIFLLVFAGGLIPALRAQEPIEIESELTEVTVYLSGAQITREADLTLKTGDNIFIFKGLANSINASSIQASAPKDVIINSVSHEINYLKPQELSPRRRQLQDSLQLVSDKITVINESMQVYTTERAMLQANQRLGGNEKGVTAEELAKAADFFRVRLDDLSSRTFKLEKERKELQDIKNRLNKQVKELNILKDQASNDIVLKVRALKAGKRKVAIRYLVDGAGWVPAYDLRVQDTDSDIKLTYRADVAQNTGIDWSDILLTLSSANPNQGGTKPSLSQWNLYAYAPGAYRQEKGAYGYMGKSESRTQTISPNADGKSDKIALGGATLADYTTVVEGATSAEFKIDIRQNIPSDGKAQQVAIQDANLPASYLHIAAPKLDPDAFLLAQVTDWESLNLLPGAVNIFFEGTYIAESFIDPAYTLDTLDFSLGRDKKVVVERNQLKDFSKVRNLGANRERTFAFEFVVRNTKSSEVNLILQDQIPVSMDEDITVKVEEASDGEVNADTGIITWRVKLAPAETKKIKLIFSVKHPKKKIVPGI